MGNLIFKFFAIALSKIWGILIAKIWGNLTSAYSKSKTPPSKASSRTPFQIQ